MIPEHNEKRNIERFSGFADVYDTYRPEAPAQVIPILTRYAGERPSHVVDVGCGTGLSTFIWAEHADRIIGAEPNEDMRAVAEQKLQQSGLQNISFIQGYSNQLELETGTVDIITCSQSFHWMEPESTLKEASRLLREGGVFAAYDCDWPPTLSWELEVEYMNLIAAAEEILEENVPSDQRASKRNKEEHLKNLQQSGVFRYTKEVVFHHTEPCDAERYVGIAVSQGGLQAALKAGLGEQFADDLASFQRNADAYFQGRTLEVLFSYRMRLGVK
ncbi:class I SAM-dependent methyltransferase [Marinicrinis lubricantis]|uniref:Class I SAM-dependent methyltransferase n=1 Tax=Marinicrinis lubricantis TaxID=2086470 RepID=A0ABW1ITU9_9BACL